MKLTDFLPQEYLDVIECWNQGVFDMLYQYHKQDEHVQSFQEMKQRYLPSIKESLSKHYSKYPSKTRLWDGVVGWAMDSSLNLQVAQVMMEAMTIGPKVFKPTAEQARSMLEVPPAFPCSEYCQPYSAIAVEFPDSPHYVYGHRFEFGGQTFATFITSAAHFDFDSQGNKRQTKGESCWAVMLCLSEGTTMEEELKYWKTASNNRLSSRESEFIFPRVQITINALMLLSGYQMDNKPRYVGHNRTARRELVRDRAAVDVVPAQQIQFFCVRPNLQRRNKNSLVLMHHPRLTGARATGGCLTKTAVIVGNLRARFLFRQFLLAAEVVCCPAIQNILANNFP